MPFLPNEYFPTPGRCCQTMAMQKLSLSFFSALEVTLVHEDVESALLDFF